MDHFPVHTLESAPSGSKQVLEAAARRYGFAPNLIGVMAESPAMVHAYWAIGESFAEHGSLTPAEQQIVLMAVSRVNACRYCMAAHSGAAQAAGVPEDDVRALREDQSLSDPRFEALRRFTKQVVERRGEPSKESIRAFLDAGFDRRAILDVVVGVAYKTLSNYTNHIAQTPLDSAFAGWEWQGVREAVTPTGT